MLLCLLPCLPFCLSVFLPDYLHVCLFFFLSASLSDNLSSCYPVWWIAWLHACLPAYLTVSLRMLAPYVNAGMSLCWLEAQRTVHLLMSNQLSMCCVYLFSSYLFAGTCRPVSWSLHVSYACLNTRDEHFREHRTKKTYRSIDFYNNFSWIFCETSRVADVPAVANEPQFVGFPAVVHRCVPASAGVRFTVLLTVLSNRFTLDIVSLLSSLHTIFWIF